MVALTLSQFQREVRASSKLVDEIARDVVGIVAGAVFGAVATATPVDTGLARGNWKLGVGRDFVDPVLQPVAGVPPQAPVSLAERALVRRMQARLRRKPVGTDVAIVNQLDYVHGEGGAWARYLDNGLSMQAPDGIVSPAIYRALGGAEASLQVLLAPLELF